LYRLGNDRVGGMDENIPDEIYIDTDVVDYFENENINPEHRQNLLFFIAVSIIHEMVHWGDFNYNDDYSNESVNGEEGYLFENTAYGGIVRISTNGSIEFVPIED
jgi:hypothetical protein